MDLNTTIISVTAIVLASLTVLIPITGLTARFALRPLMDAMAKYREISGQNEAQQLLERRFALMEDQLSSMERTLRDLSEESDFRRQLEAPGQRAQLSAPNPAASTVPASAERLMAER